MRTTSLLTIILSFVLITCAQTHAVFLDDTLLYHIVNSSFDCNYQFNDSLSDGKWVLYDIYRKDSLSVNKLSEHILLSETFTGGLRNGRSYRYRYSYNKKRRPCLFLAMTIDYEQGNMEGEIVKYQSPGIPAYTWSVSNNQLNGLCITYDIDPEKTGNVLTVSYFEKDSLIRWNDYKDGYELIGKGIRLNDGSIEYFIYEDHMLKYKCYYKNYYLEKYYEYLNPESSEKEHYGPFRPINMKDFIYSVYYPLYTKYSWIYWFDVAKSIQEE